MSNFAQVFVFACIAAGTLAVVAGVVFEVVPLGFAIFTLAAFAPAFAVLWDHARDT